MYNMAGPWYELTRSLKGQGHAVIHALSARTARHADQRRKEGCESMSLMSVGRLFQTSGPLTENARRPTVFLFDRRQWLW